MESDRSRGNSGQQHHGQHDATEHQSVPAMEWRGAIGARSLSHYPPDMGPMQVGMHATTHHPGEGLTLCVRGSRSRHRMFTLHTTASSHPQASGLTGVTTVGAVPWLHIHTITSSHSTPQHLRSHPQASEFTGVTTVGAVPWLLNYNVPLASASLLQGETGGSSLLG